MLEGERRVIRPRYLNDYLDIEGLVDGINAFLPGDGPRFAIYAPFDQTAFVVCITEIERRRLEERGWSFRRGELTARSAQAKPRTTNVTRTS